MKYILDFEDCKTINNKKVYRIIAVKDFGGVRVGYKGGYIEKESNLSHEGNCWVFSNGIVYDNAVVSDNAKVHGRVFDNAKVFDNARVYGINAMIYGNAIIKDNAKIHGGRIYDNAVVCDKTNIYDNAQVFENACVKGEATIYDNACIFGNAIIKDCTNVFGNARVYGNARVCDYACVNGNAAVCGDAKVLDNAKVYGIAYIWKKAIISEHQFILGGVVDSDLSKNLIENIRCQTGLIALNGKVTAYKVVHRDLTSIYDDTFQYKIGEIAEAKNLENKTDATSLYFSNPMCWEISTENPTYLIAEIKLEDIITVQRGQIRCKKAFILGKYDKM
jgi:hypothetical protein